MSEQSQIDELARELDAGHIDRSTFLTRIAALGVGAGMIGALGGAAAESGFAADSQSKRILKVRINSDPSNMDPANVPGNERPIMAGIYEPLMGFKPGTFELVPVLAQTWTPSKNGRRFDFTLRRGIQFHGGYGELTAQDVKFTYERIANPAFKAAYQADFAALKEVRVTGKYSGSIILKRQYAPLNTISLPVTGQILSRKAVTKLGRRYGLNPIGTGPYEFVSFRPGERVLTRKFRRYGGSWYRYIKPVIWDEIHFIPVADANAALIALESGALDWTDVSPSDLPVVRRNSRLRTGVYPTLWYNFISMNVTHPALRDINVRRAVRAAIDVSAIRQSAYENLYRPARAIIPPQMPIGYWKDAPAHNRNVAAAKAFLAASGASNVKLGFDYTADRNGGSTIAQIVQSNLDDIGIDLDIRLVDRAEMNVTKGPPQENRTLALLEYGTQGPDPQFSMVWHTCAQVGVWNYMSWCNEQFSKLDQQAASTSDAAARNRLYIQMQRIWENACNVVWLAHPNYFMGHRRDIVPSANASGNIQPFNFRLRS